MGTRALADEFGLDLQPGTSTSIGLEEVRKMFYWRGILLLLVSVTYHQSPDSSAFWGLALGAGGVGPIPSLPTRGSWAFPKNSIDVTVESQCTPIMHQRNGQCKMLEWFMKKLVSTFLLWIVVYWCFQGIIREDSSPLLFCLYQRLVPNKLHRFLGHKNALALHTRG